MAVSNLEEVVGWGSHAAWADADAPSVGRKLCEALAQLGVTHAFGVLGGGISAFAAGLSASAIRFIHTRHEAGAAFCAVEAHFATERPTVVVVTTGPGLFNALNGVMAARVDGAKLLVISGATPRRMLGRGAVQETGMSTMPGALTQAGQLFHYACQPETLEELQSALAVLATGWSRPGGFVAHIALPMTLQTQVLDARTSLVPPRWAQPRSVVATEVLDHVLGLLAQPSVIWLGHGARHASIEAGEFARNARLPVMCSPRAKGTFPEEDPLFLGVSGAAAHGEVGRYLAEHPPATTLVIGSRLGEVTTFLSPAYLPKQGWIHVDVDPSAFGAAFPEMGGIGIVAEASEFLGALHDRAAATGWYERRAPQALPSSRLHATLVPRAGEVRPTYLMELVQRIVVDTDAATVMSEAGTSFMWCNHALRFPLPNRYRTSAAWGSMGHFTAGAVGAAVAGTRRVVAIVGDGAMLMNNEINTAVAYGANVIWIVNNDAQLGLNQHGMAALGMRPLETQLPRTDFAAFATSQGATGITVRGEHDLAAAIERALQTPGPVVIDVPIDRTTVPPVLAARNASLKGQA